MGVRLPLERPTTQSARLSAGIVLLNRRDRLASSHGWLFPRYRAGKQHGTLTDLASLSRDGRLWLELPAPHGGLLISSAMLRIAFLSHHIQPVDGQVGDAGTFITLFARMLKEKGDDVTFVLTREEPHAFASDPRRCEDLRSGGIELVEVHDEPVAPSGWPDIWPMRLSEQLAP